MVVVDYYELLEVERTSKGEDLKKAADAKVKQIREAYEVLSDPRKRMAYDQQQGSGGRDGFSADPVFSELFGSGAGGSRVSESRLSFHEMMSELFRSGAGGSRVSESRVPPDETFSTLFGLSQDEFQSFGCAGSSEGGGNGLRKAAPIEKTLACSLEELYSGTTKEMKISRDIVGASGKRSTVDEVLTTEVERGWKKGTKITFPEKGDDVSRGVLPADVIFIIDEKPHGLFKRDGDDLIVTWKIPLVEALAGSTKLTTLDGRDLTVCIDTINSLTHEEVVQGEGMPIQNAPSKKGNLIIKFDIKFPNLTSDQKACIRKVFSTLRIDSSV